MAEITDGGVSSLQAIESDENKRWTCSSAIQFCTVRWVGQRLWKADGGHRQAMRCLVESGRDVVLSDNDAVWLKDPIKELSLLEGDVIGSRAPWPAKLGDPVFHVTMCMGFILFRAGGEGMAKFQSTIHEFMVEAEDDQIAINKAIASLQPVYYYNMAISDMRFKESTAPGRGVLSALPGTFRVTYLPHSTYTRYCKDVPITEETVLGHCHNWGNPQMRIQHMKEAGTWALGN